MKKVLSLAILTCVSAFTAAAAAEYIYTPTETTDDLWSEGTNWSAVPVAGAGTTLTFEENNATVFPAGFENRSTNDFVGGFQLNRLNLRGVGPSSGLAPKIILSGGMLEFVKNGSTDPIINIEAGAANAPIIYEIQNDLKLSSSLTSIQGGGRGTLLISGKLTGSGRLSRPESNVSPAILVLTNNGSTFEGEFYTQGQIDFTSIGNYGETSSLGTGGTNKEIFIGQGGGNLNYIGTTNMSSNRKIRIHHNNGAILSHSGGAGVLTYSNLVFSNGVCPLQLRVAPGGTIHLSGDLTAPAAQNTVSITVRAVSGVTGVGTVKLSGVNNFNKAVIDGAGVLEINSVADGGVASALGAGSADAANLDFRQDSTLRYVGTGHSTNRLFTLNGTGIRSTLDASGSGALNWTSPGDIALGAGTKRLTLAGANRDLNTLNPRITNGTGGTTSLVKDGAGTWVLSGANTYTGTTSVNAGTLLVNGNQGTASGQITVASGAAIGGGGIVGGNLVLANGASLAFAPGWTLTLEGTLTMDASFGVAQLRGIDGLALDWTAIASGSYTLLEGDFLPEFNEMNIRNFGIGNAYRLDDGRQAWFTNGSLTLVVVPEPGTWVCAGVGLAALLLFRRRVGAV